MSNDDVLINRDLLRQLVDLADLLVADRGYTGGPATVTVAEGRKLLGVPERPHRFQIKKYRNAGRWLWSWGCYNCPLGDAGYTTKVGAVRAGETRHSIQGLLARAG